MYNIVNYNVVWLSYLFIAYQHIQYQRILDDRNHFLRKKMVLHIPFVNFGNLKLHFKERVVSKSAPHGMGPRPLEGIHSDEVVSSCMTNASPDFGGLFSVPILRKTVK